MREHKKNRTLEEKLFLAGLVCLFVGMVALPIYFRFLLPRMSIRTCLFHAVTGFYCPGCGGTRAVLALLHGDVILSFRYHPVVPYGAAIYLAFMGSHILERLHVPHVRGLKFHGWYLYAALSIIVMNVILKNM